MSADQSDHKPVLSDVAQHLRSLPELELLSNESERERALVAVAARLGRRWLQYVLAATAGIVILSFLAAAGAILKRLCPLVRLGATETFIYVLAPQLFCGAASVWLFVRLHRRRAERLLRNYLVEHGVPVCIYCGYDLRGQTIARCPECGRPSSESLLKAPDVSRDSTSAAESQRR